MKFAMMLLSGALLVAGGCSSGVSVQNDAGARLTLDKPRNEVVDRGDRAEVVVCIERDLFDEQVDLELKALPEGVKILNPSLVIPEGQHEITLLLEADPDAELVRDHVVEIHATGPDGMTVVQTFDLTVRPAS